MRSGAHLRRSAAAAGGQKKKRMTKMGGAKRNRRQTNQTPTAASADSGGDTDAHVERNTGAFVYISSPASAVAGIRTRSGGILRPFALSGCIVNPKHPDGTDDYFLGELHTGAFVWMCGINPRIHCIPSHYENVLMRVEKWAPGKATVRLCSVHHIERSGLPFRVSMPLENVYCSFLTSQQCVATPKVQSPGWLLRWYDKTGPVWYELNRTNTGAAEILVSKKLGNAASAAGLTLNAEKSFVANTPTQPTGTRLDFDADSSTESESEWV